MKKITILGATGSVGRNTVDLIINSNKKYQIIAITGYNNYKLLSKIAIKLNCKYAILGNKKNFSKFKALLKNTTIICMCGEDSIAKAAEFKTDMVFSCIVGLAGLKPTLFAIKNTKIIALANKESLVGAGKILMKESIKYNTRIIPLDSEHNAIFKIIDKEKITNIKNIILTASGGPFWNKKLKNSKKISVKEALNHPKWKMGKKISIDSATMMNKLLEIIEASVLFNLDLRQIKILIHPDSLIHGIVNYIDGTSFLVASKPDMKIPINYALNWPEKEDIGFSNLNLLRIKELKFFKADNKKFPALNLIDYLKEKNHFHSRAVVINAANEVAVESFLNKKIGYLDIVNIISKIVKKYKHKNISSYDDIMFIDRDTRRLSKELINGLNR